MNALINRPLHFIKDARIRVNKFENYPETWGGLIGQCEGFNFSIFILFFPKKIDSFGDQNPYSNIATFCLVGLLLTMSNYFYAND